MLAGWRQATLAESRSRVPFFAWRKPHLPLDEGAADFARSTAIVQATLANVPNVHPRKALSHPAGSIGLVPQCTRCIIDPWCTERQRRNLDVHSRAVTGSDDARSCPWSPNLLSNHRAEPLANPTRSHRPENKMRRNRLALPVCVSLVMGVLTAAPVAAARPGDDVTSPIPVAADQLGIPQDYDTSLATTAAGDPTACETTDFGPIEGPFTNTVWHEFTAEANGPLVVDVNSFPDPESEGFLAILFVYADVGGALQFVGCSAFPFPGAVRRSRGTAVPADDRKRAGEPRSAARRGCSSPRRSR